MNTVPRRMTCKLMAVIGLLLGVPAGVAAADSTVSEAAPGETSFAVYVRSGKIDATHIAPGLLADLQNALKTMAAEGKIKRATIKKIDASGGKRMCVEFATAAAAATARALIEALIENVPQAALAREVCA